MIEWYAKNGLKFNARRGISGVQLHYARCRGGDYSPRGTALVSQVGKIRECNSTRSSRWPSETNPTTTNPVVRPALARVPTGKAAPRALAMHPRAGMSILPKSCSGPRNKPMRAERRGKDAASEKTELTARGRNK